MDLVWTNDFIGDVAVWAAGVDRTPLIEKPWTLSAPALNPWYTGILLTPLRAYSYSGPQHSENPVSGQQLSRNQP